MLLLARRWTALAGTLSTHTTAVAAQQRTSILLQLNLGRPGISTCTGNATNVGSHMSDNDPEALRHHKEMSLKVRSSLLQPSGFPRDPWVAKARPAAASPTRYIHTTKRSSLSRVKHGLAVESCYRCIRQDQLCASDYSTCSCRHKRPIAQRAEMCLLKADLEAAILQWLSVQGQTPVFVPQAEGWNETLASVSEAVVKAEQMVEDDAATQPAKLEVLQKHTIEVGAWQH